MKKYIIATSKPWHKPMADSFFGDPDGFLWANTPEHLTDIVQSSIGGNIRYIFFLHWNWLVPEELWETYECVCFHMTDVPYGRGGSPLQNLIARGHKDTKLTALKMTGEMDAGPVYAKRELALGGTAEEIYSRAGELSFQIIQWMIDNEPQPTPQRGDPVIFKRRKPEQSVLPEKASLSDLYDHIRMLDAPTYPHAFIEYGEFIVEFSGAEVQGEELSACVRIRKKAERRQP